MNILVVNHYAGSLQHGMEYRPYYLAREWVGLGHQVTIVAASHSHLRNRAPTIHGAVTEEEIDGIRFIWLKTPAYHGNGIQRIFNMLTFVTRLLVSDEEVVGAGKPHLVVASSTYPLDIIPAFKISRRHHARLVFEVHDLWPLTPTLLRGMPRWHPFILPLQWAEDFAYHKSDCVVSMLPEAAAYMRSRGMEASKFVHIPNGIDLKQWENVEDELPSPHREEFTKFREGNRFIVGYAGGHALSNCLDTLLDSAALLKNLPVSFVLVGQGAEKTRLQRKSAADGLSNVFFLPPVPKSSIPGLLQMMDACYIGWTRSPLYKFGVSPNKLLDYMMAGKPIIHAIEAPNDLVADSGCGVSVPPEDARAIADAVITLMNMTAQQRESVGARGREYVRTQYNYRCLAVRFLEAVRIS